jgi:hypothetical protein
MDVTKHRNITNKTDNINVAVGKGEGRAFA